MRDPQAQFLGGFESFARAIRGRILNLPPAP
jgi:hypothetical protein